jgi:hypothetical protein
MLNKFMCPFVKESVDVAAVGSSLVYGEVVYCIGSFKHTVCKAVREIEGRESPYFGRLLYVGSGIFLLVAEKLQTVVIVSETDNVSTYLISQPCLIAACLQLHTLYIVVFK